MLVVVVVLLVVLLVMMQLLLVLLLVLVVMQLLLVMMQLLLVLLLVLVVMQLLLVLLLVLVVMQLLLVLLLVLVVMQLLLVMVLRSFEAVMVLRSFEVVMVLRSFEVVVVLRSFEAVMVLRSFEVVVVLRSFEVVEVRQLERTVSLRDLSVVEMEGKLREMVAATYDGVFVWKIFDFTKKRQDAVAGRAPAMFSPAFFTSKYGYKMCLRIYLNGDGTGRGTHLSLFFVVMRGHSDALLKWPFNQKVTLMLLDQNNREHIIDAFRPDISSSSFQRPVSDMNIASGCPLFCPLAKLDSKNSYVRDDTIFIKAIVDLTGL
uniref:MATH domain-containing protein n=1 Tax=Knipowitschia caucasica TaxID=637954 RepID=A0AAV2MPV5_KNICA